MKVRTVTLTAIAAVVLGLGFACSSGGSSGGGGGGAAPGGGSTTPGSTTPTQPPAGTWLAGDLHVHTDHSGDTMNIGDDVTQTIRLAEATGLDFVSISDHRQTTVLTDPKFTGRQTNMVVLAGEEWGGSGHAGAHNLIREPLDHSQDRSNGAAGVSPRMHQVIDDIHAQGGFFVLNHPIEADNPFFWDIDYGRLDGTEVWNQPWAYRNIVNATDSDVDDWMRDKGLTAAGIAASPEVRAAVGVQTGGANRQRLAFYEALISSGHELSAVGGGDRHYLFAPGSPTTWVYAADRTPAAITEAIRNGRTWVSRAPDGPRVDFRADRNGDGAFESIIGDTIPLASTGAIDFRIAVEDAVNGKVELVRNGQVIQTWNISSGSFITTFTDQPTGPSWYRLNVYERLDMSFPDAPILKLLVMGVPLQNLGWLGASIQGLISQAQDIFNTGGPLAVYLLFFGTSRAGVTISPVSTTFPVFIFPEALSKIVNVDLDDPDFCRGAVTSAIYVK